MPKRTDIHSVLLIGAGPIVIGQACEFDYSGTQALKALKEEGYGVILVNSNPATIMTDPGSADRTYIEPLTWDIVEKIIAKERPDALLPTLGGQTALNLAMDLAEQGVLESYGVEMIGAKPESIKKAEDRDLFKEAMQRIGLDLPRSGYARSMQDATRVQKHLDLPVIIRASLTLGGSGGNSPTGRTSSKKSCKRGLSISPVHEVLIEESILGWKEYEMEVMRDDNDNVVIICSIENFDPMGVHTGDSITVAPAQTLTDKEYQRMRDASLAVIREIGVETGGSNIQFAINPKDGRMVVIEMNPRVSRSSALASKATGFPIAKIAAKLAVGYRLTRSERHHPRDDGLLRADDRLRGDENPAVCLREISRGRQIADDADEVRRRDDGHRPHVQRVVSEGAARAGDRLLRLRAEVDLRAEQQTSSVEIVARNFASRMRSRLWYVATPTGGHDARTRFISCQLSIRGSWIISARLL